MFLWITRVKRQLSFITLHYEEGKNKHHLYTSEYVSVQHLAQGGPKHGHSTHRYRLICLLRSPLIFPSPRLTPVCHCPSLSASTRPHRPRWQVPGPPLPCHRTLTPHHPVPSRYDVLPSALEINYLGYLDFNTRWLHACLWGGGYCYCGQH